MENTKETLICEYCKAESHGSAETFHWVLKDAHKQYDLCSTQCLIKYITEATWKL